MRHVEFLGVMGAGKTTIFKAALPELHKTSGAVALDDAFFEAQVRTITSPILARFVKDTGRYLPRRLLRRIVTSLTQHAVTGAYERFMTSNPDLARLVCSHQAEVVSSGGTQDMQIFRNIFGLFTKYQLASEMLSDSRPLLIDEGLAQRSISLYAYSDRRVIAGELDEYIRAIPAPAVVVLVQAPLNVCVNRLMQRSWPIRMQNLPPEKRQVIMENAEMIVDHLGERLPGRGTCVLNADGMAPIEEAITALNERLSTT